MAAIFLMLMLIFYIFGVMFTQLFSEVEVIGFNYFGSLSATLLTLFQIMTLDGWAGITREMMLTYPWAWLPFIVFVIISGFVVVNLIIAVICDAIGSLDDEEKANLQGGRYGDDNSNSDYSGEPLELREQLDTLEDQMGNLTRIQARTFHTLQYLTQQLQLQKEAKEKKQALDDDDDDDDDDEKQHKKDTTSSSSTKRPPPYEPRRAAPLSNQDNVRPSSSDEEEIIINTTNNNKNSTKKSTTKRRSGGSNNKNNKSSNRLSQGTSRVSYRDTWTQQGSSKELRRAAVSNFAKAAKELQKLRDQDKKNDSD
jgi:hypothetical protein